MAQMEDAQLRQLGLSPARPASSGPVYRSILERLENRIVSGALPLGFRLPAERRLASALQVSRTTIVRAYRELEARGLVRAQVGRGTYVAAAPETSGAPFAWRGKVASTALRLSDTVMRDLVRDASDPKLLAAGAGVPALEIFPIESFRRSLDRVLRRHGSLVWGHGPTEGQSVLRDAIAARFGGPAENVLVLSGGQQGLDLLVRCLVDADDTVIVDRPGYLGAIQTFRAGGARVVGWDVVRHDLDELEDLVLRYRPKVIYTNPTFQNPTGWTMPVKLRRDLLALAGRHRVPIIEDDTYRELHFDNPPPPALRALDTQSVVIHLNSFSKVLAPGLRLGWLTAAEPIVEQLAVIKQHADPHTQNLVQFVVADLLAEGTFDTHLIALRAEHRRRRDALTVALEAQGARGRMQWTVPDGGLYLWCRLTGRISASAVIARAREESVALVRGEAFYADHAGDRELRICFSNIPVQRADDLARRLLRAIAAVRRDASTLAEVKRGGLRAEG